MKLTELNPRWVGAGGSGITDKNGNPVPERKGCGVSFDCPCGCGERVFVHLSNPTDGGPPRAGNHPTWKRTGEDFDSLTLSPSIQRVGGCEWHGFVRNGQIVNVPEKDH